MQEREVMVEMKRGGRCPMVVCPACQGTGKIEVVTPKMAKTIKDYPVKAFGYSFIVPAGSIVSNVTACGNDDDYRFWRDWHKVAQQVTGYKNSLLAHDLTYYGLNIPAQYCEPYEEANG